MELVVGVGEICHRELAVSREVAARSWCGDRGARICLQAVGLIQTGFLKGECVYEM